MTIITRRKALNIYTRSRLSSARSRADAAWKLHISDRTLARYELEESEPPPDIVSRMADLYEDPCLEGQYCSEICAIGRKRKSGGRKEKTSACLAALPRETVHN